MKLSLSYKSLLLILFVFATGIAAAQESASKFIDSIKANPHPVLAGDTSAAVVDTVAEADSTAAVEPPDSPPDTAIISVVRPISNDSIKLIKKDKGFYYQQWLDSMLRAEEAKVKITRKPPDIHLPNLDLFFNIFQIVLWILAGGLLLFVIYKLFLGKSPLFLKNRKNIDTTIVIPEEEIKQGYYEGLVKKAEAESNYRLAVRYLHLEALFNLAEKRYVKLGTEKTNYQYLTELRSAPASVVSFFSVLTYKYEYIWYGDYNITSASYHLLKDEFTTFNKEIK